MLAIVQASNAESAKKACEEILAMINNIDKNTATENDEEELSIARDDVPGKELDSSKVKKAR